MGDNLSGPVLVTGGSGFIGTQLVEVLAKRGIEVMNIDVRAPFFPEHTAYWRKLDLGDKDDVIELIRTLRPSTIYNLAAFASLDANAQDFSVNIEGPRNIIAGVTALDYKPLIVHTSTQLVTKPGTQTVKLGELAPYSAYGESKAESERVFMDLPPRYRWTIVRPTNIWGPYHPTYAKAILKYIRKGWYMHAGSERVKRSYGYVENVAHQMVGIAEAPAHVVEGNAFYLGDEPMPTLAWANAFSVALRGRPVRRVPSSLLRFVALIGEISGRLGGPSPINFDRLERLSTDYTIPMEPTFDAVGRGPISFQEGVDKTVTWLRTQ